MDPNKLPFNALIVRPTNSGKTQYLLNQLRGPFRRKFDYIVLFCPTFVKNTTCDRFVDKDPHIFVVVCLQHEIESWLRLVSYFFEKTNNDDQIPAQRAKLAVLVLTGKSKEAIGVQLTHEQVKRLSDKDVQKYSKYSNTNTQKV